MENTSSNTVAGIGARAFSCGRVSVMRYPLIGMNYQFYNSPVTGLGGPTPSAQNLLDFSGFSYNTTSSPFLGGLNKADGVAQGLTGVSLNKYNGNVAEQFFAQNGIGLGVQTTGSQTFKVDGKFLTQVDNISTTKLGVFGLNGAQVTNQEIKTGEFDNLKQIIFDTQYQALPKSIADAAGVTGLSSTDGASVLVPAETTDSLKAMRFAGEVSRGLGATIMGGSLAFDAYNGYSADGYKFGSTFYNNVGNNVATNVLVGGTGLLGRYLSKAAFGSAIGGPIGAGLAIAMSPTLTAPDDTNAGLAAYQAQQAQLAALGNAGSIIATVSAGYDNPDNPTYEISPSYQFIANPFYGLAATLPASFAGTNLNALNPDPLGLDPVPQLIGPAYAPDGSRYVTVTGPNTYSFTASDGNVYSLPNGYSPPENWNPGGSYVAPPNVPTPVVAPAANQTSSLDYPTIAWNYGDDLGGDDFAPVILALNGSSINITQLTSSDMYFDMTGDGYKNNTAWTGANNAVLFYDPNNTNAITQANQIIFTDWDPSATSDLQALDDVFDTNHDGSLDAGDADFSEFKLMVTNANGTTSVETLAAAGITSINLTANAVNQELPDGSSIDGETTYTTSSGTTGTAATVSFATDAKGSASVVIPAWMIDALAGKNLVYNAR